MSDALNLSLDDLIKRQSAKAKASQKGGGRGGGKSGPKTTGRGDKQLGVSKGRGGGVKKATARPGQPAPLTSGGGRGGNTGRGAIGGNVRGGRAGGHASGRGAGRAGSGGVITVKNPAAVGMNTRHAGAPGGYAPHPGPHGGQYAGPPQGQWGPIPQQLHVIPPAEVPGVAITGNVIRNKLFVSNLDENVTDKDIKELFLVCGNIKDSGVHYDKTGRSLGTAHVVFERAIDAQTAYTKYNSVALDGKKINIELVETEVPPGTFAQLSSGIKLSAANGADDGGFVGGGYARGRGGGYGGRRGGRGGAGYGGGRQYAGGRVPQLGGGVDDMQE